MKLRKEFNDILGHNNLPVVYIWQAAISDGIGVRICKNIAPSFLFDPAV